jgi:enediyne polyketide synthase
MSKKKRNARNGIDIGIKDQVMKYQPKKQSMESGDQVDIQKTREPIAVIGLGCCYPGADSPLKFWENILARRREFRRIPDCRLPLNEYYDPNPLTPDKTYGKKAAVIDGFNFDWIKHRIPKSTFETTDIVHWLALEVALSSLKDAGYTADMLPKSTTGVILGNTLTGEQTRSNTMRLRWPFVRKALNVAASDVQISNGDLLRLESIFKEYYLSVFPPTNEDSLAGGLANTIAGRICNFLDVNGGGYVVDGACSSSLIAVATAANSLSNHDLDLALAGGVDISLDPFELIGFSKAGALSAHDMNVYDRNASGFIPGEGCGFVVLKRLEDAMADDDYIYAVLRGWGISSDGKGGITAPSKSGQSIALKRAYARSGYDAKDLDFIEGHGTGTPVGDRTELEGIALAIGSSSDTADLLDRKCGITSLKSIVGHTKAAAGIGAFIKATIAVNRRVLPPTAACGEMNAVFNDSAKSVYPITIGERRDAHNFIRAGVSGMGFGGINCHVTLESADEPTPRLRPTIDEGKLLFSHQQTEIFILDATSIDDLGRQVSRLKETADGMSIGELTDLSAHLTRNLNKDNAVRAVVVASTPEDLHSNLDILIEMLNSPPPTGQLSVSQSRDIWISNRVGKAQVGFLFPGQGSQLINMARKIVGRFEWAQGIMRTADELMLANNLPEISSTMFRNTDRCKDENEEREWRESLSETSVAQPAICVASLIWLNWMRRLGVTPNVVGGHSLGELVAFHAAGAFDEVTLIKLAIFRGISLSNQSLEGTNQVMAAISCSKEQANQIISQVEGYVVIANINSPEQIVISGEESAVEHALLIARDSQMRTSLLPVSNAFHSDLIRGSIKLLEPKLEGLLPERFIASPSTKLITSIDGKEVKTGHILREHFLEQIVSQVDFLSLTHSLSEQCDQIIEVGPRRILSDLVCSTVDNSLASLPVESRASNDRDWNLVVASLFLHGHNLAWELLFEGRLVREFIPASAKQFIENPCERSFVISQEQKQKSDLSNARKIEATEESLFTLGSSQDMEPRKERVSVDSSNLLIETLTRYLENRGGFLTKVISADLESLELANAVGILKKNGTSEFREDVEVSNSQSLDEEKQNIRATDSQSTFKNGAVTNDISGSMARDVDKEISEFLVNQVVKRTGFPKESITLESRLLDDLNMDSIKGGDLVAAVALEFKVVDHVDSTTLANASLQEIVNAVKACITVESLEAENQEVSSTLGRPQAQVQDVITNTSIGNDAIKSYLFEVIGLKTGFPQESITGTMRLLDDLNLDSIKSADLISEVAKRFSIQDKIDPANFANATLDEIVVSLNKVVVAKSSNGSAVVVNEQMGSTQDKLSPTSSVAVVESSSNSSSPWVRDFTVGYCLEEQTPCKNVNDNWDTANIFGSDNHWDDSKILILYEDSESELCNSLQRQLLQRGAGQELIEKMIFSEVENLDLTQRGYAHTFILLPKISSQISSPEDSLRRATSRLRIAAVPGLAKNIGKEFVSVSFIQFGEGKFGRLSTPIDIEQGCSVGFASSLHLERQDLKVRVIDLPTGIDFDVLTRKILDEVSRREAYIAVGFDSSLRRIIPRPFVRDISEYTPRSIKWSPSDVVLVTGGAKGITAECALNFARITGVKTALVGSSPHPDEHLTENNSEVKLTLDRFKSEGLSCRYFQCDVTKFESVQLLIEKVKGELGNITGVIHGAALNKPRRVENSTIDDAVREISPKVMGLTNLCRVLEGSPPKLLVSFSSISAVLGLPGNTWYGFSNEAVDLILRKFRQKHNDTSVLSLAFSVWSDVGMGARMGTVKNLTRMGIEAMPTRDGVDRFMRLMLNDPGDTQVIVSARLGGIETLRRGFDTWKTQRVKPSRSFSFLENVKIMEPNVEVVVRSHLSMSTDSYVKDHLFRGSYLFPTVFGLEAMAQAAAYVTGRKSVNRIQIENILLERPIVVDQDKGVDIEIHATVEEREDDRSGVRVVTEIRTERTGFSKAHFAATFVLDSMDSAGSDSKVDLALSQKSPLNLEPVKDLYSWLLFQGPLFQRLTQIYNLDSRQIAFKTTVGSPKPNEANHKDRAYGEFLLGDPYYRDSLLQSVQPIVPKDTCLPVKIDRIDIFQVLNRTSEGSCYGHVDLYRREGRKYFSTVQSFDKKDNVIEKLSGYQLAILEHNESYPTAEELADPEFIDEHVFLKELRKRAETMHLATPKASLGYLPGMQKRSSEERHEAEIPLLTKTIEQLE